jgi:hypothetical protein
MLRDGRRPKAGRLPCNIQDLTPLFAKAGRLPRNIQDLTPLFAGNQAIRSMRTAPKLPSLSTGRDAPPLPTANTPNAAGWAASAGSCQLTASA